MAGAGRGGDMTKEDSESDIAREKKLQTEAARSHRQRCLLIELAKAGQVSEHVMQYVRAEVIVKMLVGM